MFREAVERQFGLRNKLEPPVRKARSVSNPAGQLAALALADHLRRGGTIEIPTLGIIIEGKRDGR